MFLRWSRVIGIVAKNFFGPYHRGKAAAQDPEQHE